MKQLFIIVFFLLASMTFGQITEIDGNLPVSNNVKEQYGVMLVYPDTSVSPWTWNTVYSSSGASAVILAGNSSDTTYTVAPNGTASAFPDIACKVFTVTNFTVGEILYVGSSDQVTTGNGFPLLYLDSITYTVANSNQKWHISDGTTLDARCDSEN